MDIHAINDINALTLCCQGLRFCNTEMTYYTED